MDLLIYPKKSTIVYLTAGSALFTTCSLGLFFFADLGLFKQAGLVAGFLFFGLCTYFWGKKALNSRPSMVIGDTGIVDNASSIAVGPIPWRDIVALQVLLVEGQRFLGIDVCDPQRYAQRAGGALARLAVQSNLKKTGYVVLVPQISLAMPLEEVIGHIETRLGRTATRDAFTCQKGIAQSILELVL
ncbi:MULTISPECIES: STM3941 family protein [unclassified Janthinobacterium]|uniref:STM3941 family protein n=1 Tax=unclassified Janthinobacterium TaxID=2610881 RepID=UPI000883F411|nr:MULTISPECIES: STM3941 family protein [unclassified Janthinobacterium]SDA75476.1 hypothetical protein SAMN03159349_04109 [Janthinobacterium sp. 551a]SFB57385.1 hypothetical protein SAMN03159300_1088 [Janthinobacterium sp. 344]